MASEPNGAPAPQISKYVRSLGLARLRQKGGITLEQIADKTKISIRFLRAIEAEEFEKLPGGLFNTSYIRQYAAAIGLDESELLSHYHEMTAPPEQPVQGQRKAAGSESRNWFGRFLGIVAETPRT